MSIATLAEPKAIMPGTAPPRAQARRAATRASRARVTAKAKALVKAISTVKAVKATHLGKVLLKVSKAARTEEEVKAKALGQQKDAGRVAASIISQLAFK